MILAADVGASKTRLGLFRSEGRELVQVAGARFQNRQYSCLDAVLDAFLPGREPVAAACFGVAGPVLDDKCTITNLSWDIELACLRSRFPDASIALINDVEATAYGLATLKPGDLLVLNPGQPDERAAAALIAAGTGLGEAVLYACNGTRVPAASEAGHTDFAPSNALQSEFLESLRPRFGHVSWDRVLSGPGLVLIYEFLRDSGRYKEQPEIAARMRAQDPSAVISEAALDNGCELCRQTLHMFTAMYGAEAGNLALRALARGGLYVGGGIPPKITRLLCDGTFIKALLDKGRMASFMATIPVHVVLNDDTGLLGAARYVTVHTPE
jgi:glucokinase